MRVAAIESSCDEFACAILDHDGTTLLANIIHSQAQLHSQFGGVVPEIASRDHVQRTSLVFTAALKEAGLDLSEIDALAVTRGPGLLGCLLCGVEFAKGISMAADIPLLGVNHLEGHLAAAQLENEVPEAPYVALLVSGGHTHLILVTQEGGPYQLLGATRDDAAGEAFDKTAKILGLGYPGGRVIDELAQKGDRKAFAFPTLMPGKNNLDFSFSGLKTAAARLIKEEEAPLEGQRLADFCASFQSTVVENLLKKSFRAVLNTGTKQLVIAGGVAANSALRSRALERGLREKVKVFLPDRKNCTDNAAMIARAGWLRLNRGESNPLDFTARASWPITELS